jgi:hypothetical protein
MPEGWMELGKGDSGLSFPSSNQYGRFEVFTAVTMKNRVFWDLRRVALERTDVSEELSTSIIRVTRIGELGKTLAVTAIKISDFNLCPVLIKTRRFGEHIVFPFLGVTYSNGQELHSVTRPSSQPYT